MNIAVLCEESDFTDVKALLENKSWVQHHIKTHYESWLKMKENSFSAFVFYIRQWDVKYLEFIMLLKESFPGTAVAVISENLPEEIAKAVVGESGLGVFHPVRDKSTVVDGLDKLIKGIDVHYRKEERFRAYPFVNVTDKSGNKLKLRVSNLSFSGAEIQGSYGEVKVDDLLILEFISQNNENRSLKGIVRWVKFESDNKGAKLNSFGVEFS